MKRQQNRTKKKSKSMPSRLVKDVSNRNILKDPVLCAQFLRDYVDSTLFKDLKPEDIEDESQKYQAYLGIAFETDTVKKIRMKDKRESRQFYLISLVEHKSLVEYNVSMQLLRYMVCIWNEYGKEMMSQGKGDIRNKSFKYPPILPIVYYEGIEEWTAGFHLKERIMMNDLFDSYIPDFTYKLVRNHDYSNEELLSNEDEMSLLMMLGKAQTPEDVHELVNASQDKVEQIIKRAPEHLLELIASTVWSLCMKMNMPQEEAEQCVQKVRERKMGYWFENMEKMDIQEERCNTEKARKEAERARQQAEKTRKDLEKARKAAENDKENAIKTIVSVCKELGAEKGKAVETIMRNYHMDEKAAEEKVNLYWKNES